MDETKTGVDEFPEHGKASALSDQSDLIRNFVLWLADDKNIFLGVWDKHDRMDYSMETTDDLIAQFLGIDLKKLEEERGRILEDYRKFHASQETTPSHPQAGVSGAV